MNVLWEVTFILAVASSTLGMLLPFKWSSHAADDATQQWNFLLNKWAVAKNLHLQHFSWKSCGTTADIVKIDSISISPDPIQLGSPMKITGSGSITKQIDQLEIDVVIQKKVFVWITVPCVDGMGNCNYTDVCSLLPPQPCPEPFQQQSIPCTCPFPAATYNVKDLPVMFTPSKQIPSWLDKGDFKAHVVLKAGEIPLGCYDLELNIVGAKDRKKITHEDN
ncbi:ganglioside GM2 activator-like isoform X2 [Paramacrobiotus metropolitanus]|uniref:ganglioside GM2 activator-like isoform X2 n=1 Tax=Paramacrobiotus metropolitanus TaxID=2943436 RepID=UPI002445BD7C|nr:ganglioside GM2 activator-like isoform X2 [Paramacrobiotus metropolitanus]